VPITYQFPTDAEVRAISPVKVARLAADRLGLKILPIREVQAALVEWTQNDNFYGLQQLRGLGGAPSNVKRIGSKKYRYEPGYFGEYMVLEEAELTLKAGSVNSGDVNMSADVMSMHEQLLQRELDRIEYLIWQVLVSGTFLVTGPNGATFTDTFTIDTYSASDWSTVATATPLLDFRTMVATKEPGKGNRLGSGAQYVMNRVTANYMFANTNANDIHGILVQGGNTLNVSLPDIDKVMIGQDLGSVVVYNEGYYDDSNAWQYYVPTDKVIVIGRPVTGEPIGEYIKTRHMINGGGVGSWEYTKDYVNGVNAPVETPSRFEVHRGHQGGPTLTRPGAVVVMSV
jgi:hypothetical protein